MKKLFLTILLTAFLCTGLKVFAANDRDMFIKKLKICTKYSYVYKYTDNGKALKRSILGTMPIKSGLGCFYEQQFESGKTLKCQFPIPYIKEPVNAFEAGAENRLFKKYLDSEKCKIE